MNHFKLSQNERKNILMISPECTEHPPYAVIISPPESYYPPNVLKIPTSTHDIS